MNSTLKQKILENTFVDKVRCSLVFDDIEYDKLCSDLKELALDLKVAKYLDKELALYIYCAPLITRNMYLGFMDKDPMPDIAIKLEDAWVDLDALVTNCLSR